MKNLPERVTVIIIKNTSTLDFILPVLRQLRLEKPDIEISILYTVASKKQVLRGSRFYKEIFQELNIKQFDALDFNRMRFKFSAGILRNLLKRNPWDEVGTRIGIFSKIKKRLERYVLNRFDVPAAFSRLNPEIVLFDNRAASWFPGRDDIFDEFEERKVKVVLLPHAPHNTGPDEFTPFRSDKGIDMRPYCEYWTTLVEKDVPGMAPGHEQSFHVVGYPGFDKDWMTWLLNRKPTIPTSKPIQILLVTRVYFPREKALGKTALIVPEDDFFEELKFIQSVFEKQNVPFEITIKPHPSSNFPKLKKDLNSLGLSNWKITEESMFGLVNSTDITLGIYSTVLLIPALLGIPTMLINSKSQELVDKWDVSKEIYRLLPFFLNSIQDLETHLPEALDTAFARRKRSRAALYDESLVNSPLRKFFPDNSSNFCADRLKQASTK